MDENTGIPDFTALTAEVVSAYVAKNALRPAYIPDLIASVHRAFQGLSAPPQAEPEGRAPRHEDVGERAERDHGELAFAGRPGPARSRFRDISTG